MFLLILGIPFLYVAWWFGSRYIRQYVFKGPLANIPGPKSPSFLTGHIRQFFDSNGWSFHKGIADKCTFPTSHLSHLIVPLLTNALDGSVVNLKGPLGESFLYVFDPKAMHHIVVKDQYKYDRLEDGAKVFFGDGLLGVAGEHHKKQRKMLNPAFSSAHMRDMIPIFWDISHKLQDTLVSIIKNGGEEIDMSYWMTRMALEMVGRSGLGYSFDPMTEDAQPHPYTQAVKQLVPAVSRLSIFRFAIPLLSTLGPPRFRRWLLDISPFKSLHKVRDIVDVMHNTSVEIFDKKRKAMEEGDESQIGDGKDIMSILLKANMEASEGDKLPDHEVLAQMSTLTFAAMDTTSHALARILHLLSLHPEVQVRVREEVSQAQEKHGDLAYDELESLSYLDAVCRETLRLYPPAFHIARVANQDLTLPLSTPIKAVDGTHLHEVYVPKGTNIYISILAANRNPEVWGDDALEWKPERWLNALPNSVKEAKVPGIYSNLMTFNGGGRACIGFKFSQLEMKVVLAMLIKAFKFTPSDKEIFWAMNAVAVPMVVGGNAEVPSLPIKMELV